MVGKQNQRVRLTKQLLSSSLITLLNTKPIGKITIKEICEYAGINRSTFYLYYLDSYALLEEIERDLIDHAQEHLRNIISDIGSLRYLTALLAYIQQHADIYRTLLCRQESLSFQAVIFDTALHHLQQNLALSYSPSVAGYVYNYLIMGCLSMIKQWIEANFDLSCEDLAKIIFRLSAKAASAVTQDF